MNEETTVTNMKAQKNHGDSTIGIMMIVIVLNRTVVWHLLIEMKFFPSSNGLPFESLSRDEMYTEILLLKSGIIFFSGISALVDTWREVPRNKGMEFRNKSRMTCLTDVPLS